MGRRLFLHRPFECRQRHLAALAVVAGVAAFVATPAAAGGNAIAACFEGPAQKAAAAAKAKDRLSQSLAAWGAAKLCREPVRAAVDACLAKAGTEADDEKGSYHCIGVGANPCLDSDWASSEFRRVACIGLEERVWLDRLAGDIRTLQSALDETLRARLKEVESAFFDFRNLKCRLVRALNEGNQPHWAYGACTTETAARLAIDLRELRDRVAVKARTRGIRAPSKGFPPTREGARALLERFLDPEADHGALTAALRPRPEDYRAVYREPLAGKLEAAHRLMWDGGARVRPKAGQSALLMVFTSTTALAAGEAVLQQFPGGYAGVVGQMKPDVPIVRFKFVKPGERLGMAFDGLVHVNGRWVLMPKPWRALR